jgi:probable rRNA maturation factor
MIHIQISKDYEQEYKSEVMEVYAKKTLDYLGVTDCELSLFIGSNADIHILNRDYRHIDAPTDVLSFTYDVIDPDSKLRYLGDIILSGDKIREQAQDAGHSLERELCTLIVHGILHLNGYDHEDEADEAIMLPLQNKILEVIF